MNSWTGASARCQPLPAGGRIAIVGNSGGPEILAGDAAADHPVVVADFDSRTRVALREAGAFAQNPIGLSAATRRTWSRQSCKPAMRARTSMPC